MQEGANTTRSLTLFVSSHFMFNVLNKLQSEILSGQKREAISTLTLYSRLLRQACGMANQETISLAEEGLFLDNYLKLEKERFNENPFQYKISGFDSEEIFIPPFLLQPFVELAVLVSIGSENNSIHIEFNSSEKTITIDSPLLNNETLLKQMEKCIVAFDRLKLFKCNYKKIESDYRFLQKISISS